MLQSGRVQEIDSGVHLDMPFFSLRPVRGPVAVTAAVTASSKPSSTSTNAVAGAVPGREDMGAVVGGGRDSENRTRAGDWDEIFTAAARRRASAA